MQRFMQQLKVIVDQRERNAELIDSLGRMGMDIETKTIPIGDYIISDRVCIERKTVPDFESSIISGRLFDQLERLRNAYDLPILVLEGSHDAFRLERNVINGTVVAIYIDYGVPVLFSSGPENTAEIIVMAARREQHEERRNPSLKGGLHAYTGRQFQEFVVGNLPGIGPKLARSLLGHFKSIRRIANASIEELMQVEKIGRKKAEGIHRTINDSYDATD